MDTETSALVKSYEKSLAAVRDYISLATESPDYMWLFCKFPANTTIKDVSFSNFIYLVDKTGAIYYVVLEDTKATDPSNGITLRLKDASPVATEDGQLNLRDVLQYILDTADLSPEAKTAIKKDLEQQAPAKLPTPGVLPVPPLTLPKTINLINSKISNVLINHNELFDGDTLDTTGQIRFVSVGVSPDRAVISYVGLLYEGEDSRFKTKLRLKGYDRQMYDAISTLYSAARHSRPDEAVIITPQNIWNCMNGITDKKRAQRDLTEAQLRRLRESLDKFGNTRCDLDLTQEIRAGYLTLPDGSSIIGGRYQGKLLQFDKITLFTDKGSVVEGYRILTPPILYEYSAAKKNIISVDIELLDTQDTVNTSEDVIAFRGYLARRIAMMKNGTLSSNRIKLETIYKETGTDTPEEAVVRENYSTDAAYTSGLRKKAKNDRDKIKGILDSWIKKGWIEGYEEVKQGNTISAIDISWKKANTKA